MEGCDNCGRSTYKCINAGQLGGDIRKQLLSVSVSI